MGKITPENALVSGVLGVGYVATIEVDKKMNLTKPFAKADDWYATLGTIISLGLNLTMKGQVQEKAEVAFYSLLPLTILSLYNAAKAVIADQSILGTTYQSPTPPYPDVTIRPGSGFTPNPVNEMDERNDYIGFHT